MSERAAGVDAELTDSTPESPFNINGYVWVRLTELGWKMFDDHHRAVGLDPAPYRKMIGGPEGYQRFQLWELMHIFGPRSYLGGGGFIDGNDLWFTDPKEATNG